QDPEAPADSYTFAYTRQSSNKAKLVINGQFYDSEFGDYITSQETYTLMFTGVSSEGELLATASAKGVFILPEGYRPAKIGFTGKGSIAIQLPESSAPVSSSFSGGTLTLAGGNSNIVPLPERNAGSLTLSTSGSSASSSVNSSAGILVVDGSSLPQGTTATSLLSGSATTSANFLTVGTLELMDVSISGATLANFSSGVLDLSQTVNLGTYSFTFSTSDGNLIVQSIAPVSGASTL
ncbi:MAG TPA: hypothetical protein VIM44_02220, partial [Rariglobus sp.]